MKRFIVAVLAVLFVGTGVSMAQDATTAAPAAAASDGPAAARPALAGHPVLGASLRSPVYSCSRA